ncbi:hypothetical protein ANAPRD1_00496 [Anaplasma phagocytophilum]|nr:hypothetical protein ANAPH1_00353 [Anaplasma phagocytophilum]SCV63848.1 hypothetical protein ANAPRD1_00496 [Anaplasma phagocytophilum]SCV64509.1 hypothetical protein ANAPH2_00980 [Anaplasma phagocytophilum]
MVWCVIHCNLLEVADLANSRTCVRLVHYEYACRLVLHVESPVVSESYMLG